MRRERASRIRLVSLSHSPRVAICTQFGIFQKLYFKFTHANRPRSTKWADETRQTDSASLPRLRPPTSSSSGQSRVIDFPLPSRRIIVSFLLKKDDIFILILLHNQKGKRRCKQSFIALQPLFNIKFFLYIKPQYLEYSSLSVSLINCISQLLNFSFPFTSPYLQIF